ncbi:MAG: hypothetical protein ACYS1A_17595 [Planctomycetota bacterium]|jgi:hypothetical protein
MQYERFAGNAGDNYGPAIAFDSRTKQVDVTAWDNNLEVSASYTGNANHYEGDIEIPAGITLPMPLACLSMMVRNQTSGNVARYEIVAWYIPTEYS